jgi:hypothetical protein
MGNKKLEIFDLTKGYSLYIPHFNPSAHLFFLEIQKTVSKLFLPNLDFVTFRNLPIKTFLQC